MLRKAQAIKIDSCLKESRKELQIINSILSDKTKISASLATKLQKRVDKIAFVADKATDVIVRSTFSSSRDVVKAQSIGIVDRLLTDSAILKSQAKILAKVIAESDETAELEDEIDELEDEIDELEDEVESDDEVEEIEEEGEVEEIESEDETAELEDEIDELEDEIDELEDEVSSSRARKSLSRRTPSTKRVSASAQNSILSEKFWNFGNLYK